MNRIGCFFAVLICCLSVSGIATAQNTEEVVPEKVVVTHRDAVVFFAKYLGYFDEYLDEDASGPECLSFLNRIGVCFSMQNISSRAEFTQKDCAKVVGQLRLIFSGEAEHEFGKVGEVLLPKDIDSWIQYCIMNDVDYKEIFRVFEEVVQEVASK